MGLVLTTDCEESVLVHAPMFVDEPTVELRIEYSASDGRAASVFLTKEETEELITHLKETWYEFERGE